MWLQNIGFIQSALKSAYCTSYWSVKMKMLLTVVIGLVLYTNRLVVADDQCTQYQFKSPFYPGSSCEDIYNKNPESRDISAYYWITDGIRNVYCGMTYTGISCEDIYNNNPETGDKDGYYPINNTQWTFCNMTAIADGNFCARLDGLWRRIASIDVSAGDDCPTGWNKSSYNNVSFCTGIGFNSGGCYSAFFPTNGVSYQHVCGRARGYQKGSPDGFENIQSIDIVYVNGLSITHGNPRQHIWTFAVGLTDHGSFSGNNCPCAAIPGPGPPSFVDNNFYCESGALDDFDRDTYYLSDPLWDGAGCSANNTCCSNTNQPWFHHQLSGTTQDDIEVRICVVSSFSNEAILVDILELYIQQQ